MSLSVDIRKSLGSFDLDVSFEMENETLGLLGASGCGKSMTLRCIAGVEKPDSGRIVINDRVLFDSEKGINLPARERKTALLFQSFQLFPNMTVEKNIGAGIGKEVSAEERAQRIRHQLERFQLVGLEKRYPAFLSGGQQQRVALARMLAAQPGALFLDEPFSALDAHLKAQLEEDLLDLFGSFEGSVVYVSHDIDEAFRFCNRIAVMDDGRIREIAKTTALVKYPHTLATAKITGCENTSAARKINDYTFEALDWGGMRLTSSNIVPDDLAYVAVRAFYISPAQQQSINVVPCTVQRVSDSRFERTVGVRPLSASSVNQLIQWNVDKLQVPETQLPNVGDEVSLFFNPRNMYLLTE